MNDRQNNNRITLPSSDVESDFSDESLGEKKITGLDTRFNIKVISYRKRHHDPDNISVKAVLDGVVRAGILQDDSTKFIKKITFESEISREEKTIIVFEKLKYERRQ